MRAGRLVLALLGVGVLLMGLGQAMAVVLSFPLADLTRDWQPEAGVPVWTGALSIVTGMAWASVAALCLHAALLLPEARRRFLVFGAFVLVLAFDDAFLVHEVLGPRLGIPQALFLVCYAVLAAGIWVWLRRAGDGAAAWAYFTGAALLGISAAADQLLTEVHLIEDGAKLLGALAWLSVPMIMTLEGRPQREPR